VKKADLMAVDMFCGAGGASTGLVRACDALGIKLWLLAINHWPTAVQTHLLNHPNVQHKCEAIERIDPRVEVPGGRLHLLLAGPECTHFSTARGGRPVNPQSRASAWHIAKWAQELYIDTILIENVPEFRTWGPVGVDGRPLKSKKGETFKAFIGVLQSLGYRVEVKILNAADYGDPTTRQRLFILARRGKHHISWPAPSHSKHGIASLFGATKRWTPARDIIDWGLQGKSIFNRKKPLRPATIARILAGLEKFGGPELKPFLVVLRNNADGKSIEDPVPTLAAEGQHVGLAQPFVMPVNHGAEELRSRSIEEPLPTLTGRANQYLVEPMVLGQQSNAAARPVDQPVPTIAAAGKVALIEPLILGQQSGSVARPVGEPVPTIATDGAIALVEPFIFANRTNNVPKSINDPVPSLCTGDHIAVIEPCLVQTNERRDARVQSVDDPVRTITAAGGRCIGLVEPILVDAAFGAGDAAKGTERRGSGFQSVDSPLGTLPGSNRYAVAEAALVAMEHGGRELSVDKPVPTITTARGGAIGVAEAFVISAGGANLRQPRSADEPLPTVMGSDRLAVAEPFIVGAGGPERAGEPKSVEDPMGTVLGRQTRALVEPVIASYYGTNNVSPVTAPLPTVTTKDRFALVQPVINGMALDIRFRMLQPHELAAAMSFPKEYKFTGKREDVVRQIGNAWPGELAMALCKAIAVDYAPKKARRRKVA
jgi:DNA (cytosine-5)-methyltransferase 1